MKLQAPKGAEETTVGIAGKEYQVNKRGIVDVPDEHVAALAAHGFLPVGKDRQPEPPVADLAQPAESTQAEGGEGK